MEKQLFIQLIADYGPGDPASAEIIQKFQMLVPGIQINPVPVPSYSTVATGFWIAQLATVHSASHLVIFSNTAPRKKVGEDDSSTYKGKFGHLAYTRLANGVLVVAVHYGFAFSFLKPEISELRLVNVPNVGSQFRSRDYYPDGVIGLAQGKSKYVGEVVPLDSIPDVPANRLTFIDSFENLKTTNRLSGEERTPGTKLRVTCNGLTRTVIYADQTYDVDDGQLVYAPGSSGGSDRFMEFWVRNGSAWGAFGKPHVESEFSIEPV